MTGPPLPKDEGSLDLAILGLVVSSDLAGMGMSLSASEDRLDLDMDSDLADMDTNCGGVCGSLSASGPRLNNENMLDLTILRLVKRFVSSDLDGMETNCDRVISMWSKLSFRVRAKTWSRSP